MRSRFPKARPARCHSPKGETLRGFRETTAIVAALFLSLGAAAGEEPGALTSPMQQYVEHRTPDWIDRATLAETLVDAGDNWEELAGALLEFAPPADAGSDTDHAYANMLWLIETASHLDRLELTRTILVDNMYLALAAADRLSCPTDSEFFRRYVLNYRLDDEPVTDWRPVLAERYGTGRTDRVQEEIVEAVTAGFTIVKRGYYGNLADPVSIDNARAGSERELTILTAAALRSQGYAVRFVRENRSGASWVEVYTGPGAQYDPDSWTPVYPGAPEFSGDASYAVEICGGRIAVVTAGDAFGREQVTARYTDVCAVQPHFTRDAELEPGFEHFGVSAWHEGTYVPLDDLAYPVVDEGDSLALGQGPGDTAEGVYYVGAPGGYQLQAGVRYPGGIMHMQTWEFSAEPGGLVELDIVLDSPVDVPLEALVERRIADPLPEADAFLGDGCHLIVIHDEEEPSVITLAQLEHFGRDSALQYEAHHWPPNDPAVAERLANALKVSDGDQLPIVILVVDGETRLYLRGFNKSIGEWVERALAESQPAEVSSP